MKPIHIFTFLLGIVLCSASLLGDYQPCTDTEINDDTQIQGCLSYGNDQLYQAAVQQGKVQDTGYTADNSATQVYKQSSSGGSAYVCSVSLNTNDGETIDGSYTVYYDDASGSQSFLNPSYTVTCTGQKTATSTGDQGTYIPVSSSTVQKSSTIQSCVNYGAQQVLQSAANNKKISGAGYKISSINSVQQKTDSSGTYYKCNVDVTNYDDCVVTLDYNVYYQPSSKQKTLASFTYDVQKVGNQAQPTQSDYQELTPNQYDFTVNNDAQDCLMYGLESILSNYLGYTVSSVGGVWQYNVPNEQGKCYYKYQVGLVDNKNDKTATGTITVWFNPTTQEKKLTAFSCNTQNNGYSSSSWSGSSTSSTYTKLSTSAVTSNSKYTSVMKYGVAESLQSLYNNNVISDTSGYAIKGINIALVKTGSSSETYKFRVSIKNKIGVSLQVDYNVDYEISSGKKTMTWYSCKGASPVNYGDVLITDYNANSQNSNDYQVDVGSYDDITSSDLTMYPSVQDTLDYGISETVKTAAKNEGIPSSGYKVKELRTVCRDSNNAANYRVDVTVTNSQGNNLDCSFSVSTENGNKLTGYTYAAY